MNVIIIIILILWLAACFAGVRIRQITADEGIFAELRQHSAAQSVAENFRQDWKLYVPVLLDVVASFMLEGDGVLYAAGIIVGIITEGMIAAVMVYFILTRDIRMNLMYLLLLILVALIGIFALLGALDGVMFRTALFWVINWVILYATARFVRAGHWRPVLLLVMYYALEMFLTRQILFGYSYFYAERLLVVAVAAAFLYWLTKYKAAAEVYEL